MTRTVPTALAAKKAARATTSAICLRLDLRDGTSLGITTHDVDIAVNLGDGALTYQAATGVLPSAVALSLGLNADSFEARGPIGAAVTRAAVLGGRYNRARARLFEVDFLAPTNVMAMLAGKVAGARVEAGQFIFEVRSASDAYNQAIGRVLSPQCSHDFGVGQCQATPQTWAATVSTVTDAMRFTVTWDAATPTADDIRNGLVSFDSGALVGTLPMEVFNLSGFVVETYQPLVEAPQVGDTLTVTEGCDKTRDTCKLKGQILNFGGFPDLTGTDQYVKYPIPKSK